MSAQDRRPGRAARGCPPRAPRRHARPLARGHGAVHARRWPGPLDPASPGCSGTCSTSTEAADPTPSLAATLFELAGEPPPGPDSALVRWLLAEPVVTGRDAFACSTGWRADARLLRALAGPRRGARARPRPRRARSRGGRLVGGTTGRVVEPPPGPVLRPAALEEIVGFVRKLGSGRRSRAAHRDRARRRARVGPDGARRPGRGAARIPARRRGRGRARGQRRRGCRRDPRGPPRAPRGLGPRVGARRGAPGRAVGSHPAGAADVPVGRAAPVAGAAGHRSIRRSVRCEPIGRPRAHRSCGRRSPRRRLPRRSPSGRCGPPRSASPRTSRQPATTRSVRSAAGC